MKARPILPHHMPLADMIREALDFCESMLMRSGTLHPFALLTANNDIHCVFLPHTDQAAPSNMIESLQAQLKDHTKLDTDYTSVLVYAADVNHPSAVESDALVFTITDTQGHNTITLYPYKRTSKGIDISHPCTCDFLD